MKIKFWTVCFLVILMNLISGCGSGGGGSSSSTLPTNGGGTGGGGGSSNGGNGQAAYYGVSTDGSSPLANLSVAPTGGTLYEIAGQMAINIRGVSNRSLDFLVYQPTCIVGLLTEEYSAVLVSNPTGTSPTLGAVTVSALGISFQARSVSTTNNGSYGYGSPIIVSGSCNNGEMNLSNSGNLYSN